jgi:hypothetical protein
VRESAGRCIRTVEVHQVQGLPGSALVVMTCPVAGLVVTDLTPAVSIVSAPG